MGRGLVVISREANDISLEGWSLNSLLHSGKYPRLCSFYCSIPAQAEARIRSPGPHPAVGAPHASSPFLLCGQRAANFHTETGEARSHPDSRVALTLTEAQLCRTCRMAQWAVGRGIPWVENLRVCAVEGSASSPAVAICPPLICEGHSLQHPLIC